MSKSLENLSMSEVWDRLEMTITENERIQQTLKSSDKLPNEERQLLSFKLAENVHLVKELRDELHRRETCIT